MHYLLALFLALTASADTSTTAPPLLLFGTVNFNQQLADHPDQWRQTAQQTDGMLLHVHYFVRGKDTLGGNYSREQVVSVGKALAPALAGKQNCLELTFHIRDATTDPAALAREHAKNVADIERDMGIPITDVNVDWILSIFEVARTAAPRTASESDTEFADRLVTAAKAKSRIYVDAFRAAGRTERLHAVFPPVYLNQGPWQRRGRNVEPGTVQLTEVLTALFEAGFDGFTADTPLFLIADKQMEQQGYHDALRAAQEVCQTRGKTFGMIVNEDVDHRHKLPAGDEWDRVYQQGCLEVISRLPAMRLRPQRIIVESWYKGPYTLVPETAPGSFTHTVLQVHKAIRQQ
jgi:hypothetical protein